MEIARLERGRSGKAEKFVRIHRDFPVRPLPGQCAYVLRAFSGLQVFPDANHRSALYFLRVLLWQRGIVVDATPMAAAELLRKLKDARGAFYTGGLAQDELLVRDDSYRLLVAWFEERLRFASLTQPVKFYVLRRDTPPEPWDWSVYHEALGEAPVGSPRRPSAGNP